MKQSVPSVARVASVAQCMIETSSKPICCKEIAHLFGISQRQVMRDIAMLSCLPLTHRKGSAEGVQLNTGCWIDVCPQKSVSSEQGSLLLALSKHCSFHVSRIATALASQVSIPGFPCSVNLSVNGWSVKKIVSKSVSLVQYELMVVMLDGFTSIEVGRLAKHLRVTKPALVKFLKKFDALDPINVESFCPYLDSDGIVHVDWHHQPALVISPASAGEIEATQKAIADLVTINPSLDSAASWFINTYLKKSTNQTSASSPAALHPFTPTPLPVGAISSIQ